MKPILIIGARGTLGRALVRVFEGERPIAWDRENIDIADPDDVRLKLRQLKPSVIINAAAYNAVDTCETDPEEQKKAMAINGRALEFLSEVANVVDALLIHYSTDYVFDGSKKQGYAENDRPQPLSFYGQSKLAGERAVQAMAKRYYLLRLSRLFGKPAQGQMGKKSFVDLMLDKGRRGLPIEVVNDERSSPTCADDLALLSHTLLPEKVPYGIYHGANEGACTWFEFAQKIFEFDRIDTNIKPVSSDRFPRAARRPSFSMLNNTKLPPARSWKAALQDCLQSKMYV